MHDVRWAGSGHRLWLRHLGARLLGERLLLLLLPQHQLLQDDGSQAGQKARGQPCTSVPLLWMAFQAA